MDQVEPRQAAQQPKRPHGAEAPTTWVGRFLADVRTYADALTATAKALLAFAVAVAAIIAASVWTVLPAWGVVALLALPFVLALVHFLATRPRRRPYLLPLTDALASRYFRIGPYLDDPRDREAYGRADGAHEAVRDWLLRVEGAPLYLTGDSGAGKSSLLQAFVLPGLQASGWRILSARALADPEASLRAALKAGDRPLRDAIAAAVPRARQGQAAPGLLLLLDQFEEFLILRQQGEVPGDAPDRFLDLIAALKGQPIPRLRLLLVLRKDYQTDIERAGLPPLRQGENWREVDSFTPRDAFDFLKASGLGLDEAGLMRLVEGVIALDGVPAKVRPITLNMVGFVLQRAHGKAAKAPEVAALLRDHVASALRRAPDARRLLPGLLTDAGTKRARNLAALAAEVGLDPPAARTALLNLQGDGLVRPLGAEEEIWEIAHDFVARLLDREIQRPRARTLRLFAPRAAGPEAARIAAEAEARRALADLGVFVRAEGDGGALVLRWEASVIDNGRLARARPYLALFAGRLVGAGLTYAPVTDLAPLAGMTALQSLNLRGTPVTDLAPLAGMTALQSLDLSGTRVTDLAPLAGMTALQRLHLSGTTIPAEARARFIAERRRRGLPPLLED